MNFYLKLEMKNNDGFYDENGSFVSLTDNDAGCFIWFIIIVAVIGLIYKIFF